MLADIYQLCPPLFSLGLLRIDSPARHSRESYEHDKEYFRLHSGRNLYLRTAYMNEFDIAVDVGEWLRVPRLNVLVTRLAAGVHQITPIYRGKEFFYTEVATDAEIALIVIEMARQNGMNAGEWAKFEAEWTERTKSLPPSTDGDVN